MTQPTFVLDLTNIKEEFPDYVTPEPVIRTPEEYDERVREKIDFVEFLDEQDFLDLYVSGKYFLCFMHVGKFDYLNVLEGILEDEHISLSVKVECIHFAFKDGIGHYLNFERWENILKKYSKNLLTDELDKKLYQRLPETLTVYRGVTSDGINGFSWTLNRKVAKWFAIKNLWGDRVNPMVLKGKINKSDIITVYGNKEEEVVAFPEDIRLTATIKVKNISQNFNQAIAA